MWHRVLRSARGALATVEGDVAPEAGRGHGSTGRQPTGRRGVIAVTGFCWKAPLRGHSTH
jgi:hypothetical protein